MEEDEREALKREWTGARKDTFVTCLLRPGKARFVVEAPGWRTWKGVVEVKAGGLETVEVELEEETGNRRE